MPWCLLCIVPLYDCPESWQAAIVRPNLCRLSALEALYLLPYIRCIRQYTTVILSIWEPETSSGVLLLLLAQCCHSMLGIKNS